MKMKKRFPYTRKDFEDGVGDYIEFKYHRFDPNLDWDEMLAEYEYVFGKRPESEEHTVENHSKILWEFLNLRKD